MTDAEFDPSSYPDQVSCKALPPDGDMTEIEIADAEDNKSVLAVPSAAIRLLPAMPQLPSEMPREAHELMKQGAGLALLACRIVERDDKAGLVRLELPTMSEPTSLTVPIGRLPRRR